MQHTEESLGLVQNLMNEPQVLAIGLVAGFVLAKALAWRKNRNSFGGGL